MKVVRSDATETSLCSLKRKLERQIRLPTYPFYSAALGELELRLGRCADAREHFRVVLALTRSPIERRFIDQRIRACERR